MTEAELLRAMMTVGRGDLQATVARIDQILDRPDPYPPIASAAAAFRTVLLTRMGDLPAADLSLVDTLNRVAPQRVLQALVPASGEPGFLDQLRRHVDGPNPHPFAALALEKLTDYLAAAGGSGGRGPGRTGTLHRRVAWTPWSTALGSG
jgi:hypothetical protein